MPRFRSALLFAALASASLASAEEAPSPAPAGTERMSTLIVFGDDPCPKSSDDEIIVCARLPESDRYRIPKRFRHKEQPNEGGESWVNRAATLDVVSRAGLPDSCSPIGSGGQTGCYRKFREQWAAERRAENSANADVP